MHRLPTRVNLSRRGVLLDSHLCPLCNAAMEDVQHVFFRCDVARVVLRKICRWWDLDWQEICSFSDWDAWFLSFRLSSRLKSILEGVFYVAWWRIWRLRNQLVFDASPPNRSTIFDDIDPTTGNWYMDAATPHRPLHLNNALITPDIIKNLIYVRQFVRNNHCIVEFDAFGFSVKDFMTRQMLLPCDSTEDLCSVTKPSPIPHAFLTNRANTAYILLYVDDIVLTASSKVLLKQHKYVADILELAQMVNCNPSRTPVDTESKLRDDGDRRVCLYMHDLREPHFSALKRILRYVRGSLDHELQLFYSSTTSLVAYSDVDWAGCPTTRRSTSGYFVFLGNNLLSLSFKRQLRLSRFSAEAEDNVSVVYMSSNLVQHQRTKHIKIEIDIVRDLVVVGQIQALHVPSRYQYEDIFTKVLPSALFEEFRTSLSIRCPLAQTAGEC
ncbi:ribonuclease H-like domain-containing protein [Tanacetum coccineum]